ncbi:hypothetical protein VFPFJ_04175 [Purpureocillium lilacinum]|uniref:Uncharacterized protein n=1 Tax=Purpureocillium lilacinum TaxID=33203 RepID=A0A179HPR9_PURLI|nr:hypothetical protein VFPFJ_04175 [Purpureocillium lilacinum]OAQ92435.1 hypothetical protein VFPFJ_04175 [Purpureocillium lilacinum]
MPRAVGRVGSGPPSLARSLRSATLDAPESFVIDTRESTGPGAINGLGVSHGKLTACASGSSLSRLIRAAATTRPPPVGSPQT